MKNLSAQHKLDVSGDEMAVTSTDIERAAPTPMSMIELAVNKGADASQLAVLMELQLKWQANESRLKFENAFESFKRNLPQILKTKHVSFPTSSGGRTEYNHAELDKITPIIAEALLNVGIVHQWKTTDANNRTTVVCVLKGFGHTEDAATLAGPPDTSGGKNNVQAIGSTVTYLQRYTLLAACGIAAKGTDNDGKTEGMPEEAIIDYCIQLQDAANLEELKPIFKECWDKAKKVGDSSAQERFRKVYEGKKKEFQQ